MNWVKWGGGACKYASRTLEGAKEESAPEHLDLPGRWSKLSPKRINLVALRVSCWQPDPGRVSSKVAIVTFYGHHPVH